MDLGHPGLGDAPRDGDGSIDDLSGAGLLARKHIYSGRIVRLSLDTVCFPDGGIGEFEIVTHSGASAILPFVDPPNDPDPRIILVHQYRYAVGGLLYEVPAGMPNSPEESWVSCARRELVEETGFEACEIRYLSSVLTTPGFTDERIHLFAATDLHPRKGDRDSDEFLDVVRPRFSEALEGIRTGEIVDAKSISVLLFVSAFLGTVWKENRKAPPR